MFDLTPENIENIQTTEDFICFLKALENDFKLNKKEWQNTSLDTYFESLAAWITDSEPQIKNIDFGSMAKILYMGKLYE